MALFNRQKRAREEKIEQGINEYFKLISAYSPAFKTFGGGVYEMELTRAAIHAKANAVSRLKPIVKGTENKELQRMLQYYPNSLMDTKKYLYRIATILQVQNNCFIAPLYDNSRQRIVGLYPIHPQKAELKRYADKLWLVYKLDDQNTGAVEFEKCGRLTQFQNENEIFGESNRPLLPTLKMMDAQDQAILNAVQNSSNIKLLAKLSQTLRDEDIVKARKQLTDNNLAGNDDGVLVIDAKYSDVKQLTMNQFTIDDKQMALIKDNVFNYFGVSEAIIQGRYTSSEFTAFYESQIEPLALELSLQHTKMLFTDRERAFGNEVLFGANRFDFLNASEKVGLIQTLFDRGLLTPNEARDIINMPPIDNGDNFYIRKEYTENYNEESSEGENDNDTTGQTETEGSGEYPLDADLELQTEN